MSFDVQDLKLHNASNAFACMHEMEGIVDFFERHFVRYQRVDLDAAIHIHIDDTRYICAASDAFKSDAFPRAARDELKWAVARDFMVFSSSLKACL